MGITKSRRITALLMDITGRNGLTVVCLSAPDLGFTGTTIFMAMSIITMTIGTATMDRCRSGASTHRIIVPNSTDKQCTTRTGMKLLTDIDRPFKSLI